MSYILDALRRAEAERAQERAEVPGLHDRQFPEAAPDGAASTTGGGVPWRWVVIGLGAGVLLPLLSWWALSSDDPSARPAPMASAQDTPSASRTPPPLESAPPPPPERARAPAPQPAPPARDALVLPSDPLPAAPSGTAPAVPRGGASPAPAAPAAPAGSAAARTPAPMAPPSGSQPPPTERTTAAPAAPATASRGAGPVLSLEDMPPEIRRELPSLQVGGSVYSDDPASRLLILNGQLFHERDQVQTGLIVEQIRAKSAILNFKGYRYQIAY